MSSSLSLYSLNLSFIRFEILKNQHVVSVRLRLSITSLLSSFFPTLILYLALSSGVLILFMD